MSSKRLNYFNHQFLDEKDFKAEQLYHIDGRRRHNRLLHSWGVAEGLEVRRKGDREIVIDAGTAYDREGQEIILASPVTHDVGHVREHSTFFVTIRYREYRDKEDFRSSGGVEEATRITEGAEIDFIHEAPEDGSDIPLARIHLDESSRHIRHVHTDIPQRKRAGGRVSPVSGWLRLPFKPERLETLRVGERLRPTSYKERDAEAEFVVDVASTYCGERGARGTMGLPPPPGASRLRAFRIAGETSGSVQMELFRTGWNLQESKGEQTLLIRETVSDASFHRHVDLKEEMQYLNPESHTLALSVVAEGRTTIWLVAAQFE